MQRIENTAYHVDQMGNFYDPHGKLLEATISKNGYALFTIKDNNDKRKCITAHIIVWKTFKGDLPPGGIKHIDSNPQNNALYNLAARHPTNLYLFYAMQGISITKIAKYYRVPKKEISKYISIVHPGGIRDLRKNFPLNKLKDIA